MYGNRNDSCTPERKEPTPGAEEGTREKVGETPANTIENQANQRGKMINLEVLESYGPWMLATRHNRRKKSNPFEVEKEQCSKYPSSLVRLR